MRQDDLEANRHIRRVLVRHWVDLGRLSFRCVNGVVWIRGTLQRLFGVKEPLSGSVIEAIFQEIQQFSGIKRIHAELENWKHDGTQWICVGSPQLLRRPVTTQDQSSEQYIIKDKKSPDSSQP